MENRKSGRTSLVTSKGKLRRALRGNGRHPRRFSMPDLLFDSPPADEIRILSKDVNPANLKPKFEAAVGPHSNDPNGTQRDTNGNPYWPHNNPHEWVNEFGARTAKAVGEAINSAVKGLSIEGFDLPGLTGDMMRVVSEHLATTLQAVSDASAGLQRRTNPAVVEGSTVLLEREDELSRNVEIRRCSADGLRHVPTCTHILSCERRRLPAGDSQRFAGDRSGTREPDTGNWVERTRDADVLAELRTETAKLVTAPAGRGSTLGLIGHPDAVPQIDDRKFRELFGVKPDTMLTLPEWSVWIFRELQAARAIAEASAPKRRTSRKRTPRK